jgi:hypothetical protein
MIDVLGGFDLRGCVGEKTELEFLPVHPVPIVGDPDLVETSRTEGTVYLRRSRVEGVIDELPNDGAGTIDDLPRGDLAKDLFREDTDPPGRRILG